MQLSDQETTSYFPNKMMLGREARLPVDLIYGSIPVNSATSVLQFLEDLKDRMCRVHDGQENTLKVQATNKCRNTTTAQNSNRTKTVTSDCYMTLSVRWD